VDTFRKALYTKRLAWTDQPQDGFPAVGTDLRELYGAGGQEHDQSDRISFEEDRFPSLVTSLMSERNDSPAVF
jgi:hypothetical protein